MVLLFPWLSLISIESSPIDELSPFPGQQLNAEAVDPPPPPEAAVGTTTVAEALVSGDPTSWLIVRPAVIVLFCVPSRTHFHSLLLP